MTAVADRVAAGAAFLDEHDPDWWRADVERAIDLDQLNLAYPSMCILGQRCPLETLERFVTVRYAVPLGEVEDPEDYAFWALGHQLSGIPAGADGDSNIPLVTWSASLGFNADHLAGVPTEFEDLTDEWRRVIEARRSA